MPLWKNAPLEAFHGTDTIALRKYRLEIGNSLIGFSVNLELCRPRTDFGKGFYVTTSEKQARNWANTRVRRNPPGVIASAVVLLFKIERDWLSSLDCLSFVRPSAGFFDLVEDCRGGIPPHQRRSSKKEYDVVFGPVTLWPQDMVVEDADQISFHTDPAADGLPAPTVLDMATTPNGLFQRLNR